MILNGPSNYLYNIFQRYASSLMFFTRSLQLSLPMRMAGMH